MRRRRLTVCRTACEYWKRRSTPKLAERVKPSGSCQPSRGGYQPAREQNRPAFSATWLWQFGCSCRVGSGGCYEAQSCTCDLAGRRSYAGCTERYICPASRRRRWEPLEWKSRFVGWAKLLWITWKWIAWKWRWDAIVLRRTAGILWWPTRILRRTTRIFWARIPRRRPRPRRTPGRQSWQVWLSRRCLRILQYSVLLRRRLLRTVLLWELLQQRLLRSMGQLDPDLHL